MRSGTHPLTLPGADLNPRSKLSISTSSIRNSGRSPDARHRSRHRGCNCARVSRRYSPRSAPPSDVKGLWITTDYPKVSLRAGEETKLNVALVNYNLAPQRTDIAVQNVPAGWSVELRGGGRPVAAAFVEHNAKSNLELKVKVPGDAKPGAYSLLVKAASADRALELPITVTVQEQTGARLTAEPKLPVLRGTPKSSFDFKVNVKNDSADDILATLAAQAPRGFQVTFKEGFGSQELTSIPIKAGDSKELSVDIKPSANTAAGKYPINVEIGNEKARAATQLTLDVSGQPTVTLTGENDRLSGEAYAGREKRFVFVLRNTGSADARNIELSSSPPSGWKVAFEPKAVPVLAPNGEQKFEAIVVPSDKAVTGDYMFTVRANGDGVSESGELPHDGADLDAVGRDRPRRDRGEPARPVRCGREVRPAMSEPVIKAEALTKRYGRANSGRSGASPDATLAVDRLDLSIERGEVFGLLGPNGAGKTTTILMILGLTEPTSGIIRTVGYDPLRQPLEVKRRVGYLPDSVGFYDHMTGRDNLVYTARLGGIKDSEISGRITQALGRVNLIDAGDKPVRTYSRGMRQRLGIAEIIMRKVDVAILDEPTNGLDPQSTREFLELIRSLKNEGMTIVLSSHLLDLVQTICDRVALFSNGRIGLMGRVQDLMRDVLGGTTVVSLETAGFDAVTRLAGITGIERVTPAGDGAWRIDATRDVRSEVAKRVVESGGELKSLSIGVASLDDVYQRYFAGVRHAA